MTQKDLFNYNEPPKGVRLTNNYQKYGYVRGNMFVKHVKPEHFFHKYNAFGVSVKVLEELKTANIPLILHVYTKRNSDVSYYLAKREEFELSHLNWTFEGNDVQKFVPVVEMQKIERMEGIK